ncbi:glycosyl transferase GT2 family [Methanobrevibacter ruminantium M1]|uniref:Glycosyl transferase GT2 family n=1 Tax=Methanobrevibacter ruminantium (strain ATCC 35063 / DSM 1093 / JCM 13430 / OCM 146 / M1) TaxID=634498 RepID=D3E2Z8_METRM|nr:glycosyltransferase family 2 protein [Methanobrevibacter ruminantium]ADC46909.1 glycosyl transferase GT2 family [Methanobrevibacter ruminantium M1]
MHEYEISIIIPTYNSSKTIERTIHSILTQDFKNYEMVFVDDASNDDTVSCIQETLADKKVNYQLIVNKNNKGPAYCRNRGVFASRGKYIVFVDSDDLIQFNHISSLHNYVKSDNFDSAFTKGIKINNQDELIDFKVDKYDGLIHLARKNKGIVRAKDLINLELLMKIPFSFVLLIYDKEIILNNSLEFNEDYRYGEDTDFALRYLANCGNVRVIDKYTYFYYQEEDSISRQVSLDRFESVKLFESLDSYFKEDDLREKLVHSRIPRFIFGNMNYFFYNGYNSEDVFKKMDVLDLFNKLRQFKVFEKRDWKFYLKVRLFLLNHRLYYKLWLRFKNNL